MGLKAKLTEGEMHKVTLIFEHAGPVEIEFMIDPPMGEGMGDMDHLEDGRNDRRYRRRLSLALAVCAPAWEFRGIESLGMVTAHPVPLPPGRVALKFGRADCRWCTSALSASCRNSPREQLPEEPA